MIAELNEALRTSKTLDELIGRLQGPGLTPGWIDSQRKTPILRKAPYTEFKPMHWSYATAHAGLEAAGRLIDTKLAERRNLVMRNPIEGNEFSTTRTQVCAYQSMLPGEIARSHRHSPHALRVILDAEGAYSTVDGEKHPMETGDVVLTPGWSWHGHGHEGQDQAYWFDGLDVPLVQLLEPMFTEEHPEVYEPVKRITPDSPYRFTWENTQRQLDKATVDHEGRYGRHIHLEGRTMPTIEMHVHRYGVGEKTRPYREAANNVWVVMQGSGVSTIGETRIEWAHGDTIAAPLWHDIRHEFTSDTVLFRMTDEQVMRFCSYYRRQWAD
jgi:gentisate 1,2-dioxygenase